MRKRQDRHHCQHVDRQREVGQKTRQTIDADHEYQHESEAERRGAHRLNQVELAERRTDRLFLDDLNADGQRAGVELVGQRYRRFLSEGTGNLAAIVDRAIDDGRREITMIEKDAQRLLNI